MPEFLTLLPPDEAREKWPLIRNEDILGAAWLPHDGTGVAEWQGFIPWGDMPHALNPEQGWLVSWNNKPAPGWENSTPGFGSFGPVHRVNTLVNLLKQVAPGSATTETLETINRTAERMEPDLLLRFENIFCQGESDIYRILERMEGIEYTDTDITTALGRRVNQSVNPLIPRFEEWPEEWQEQFWDVAGDEMARLGYC